MLIPKAEKPPKISKITKISGIFGKCFKMNLRCGCTNTKITQNIAKYIMYGVKIERSIAMAKIKLYKGFGRFSP